MEASASLVELMANVLSGISHAEGRSPLTNDRFTVEWIQPHARHLPRRVVRMFELVKDRADLKDTFEAVFKASAVFDKIDGTVDAMCVFVLHALLESEKRGDSVTTGSRKAAE
jgi:hypothetical protein